MENELINVKTKSSKVSAFFKRVFVHNIGWKLLSICSAFVIWALAAGLW